MSAEPREYLDSCLQESLSAKKNFVEVHGDTLISAAKAMASVIESGGKILICGNGGSAADAQHMAAEMVGRLLVERSALPAIALTTDSSNLTAIGNDYGYDLVFERQVRGLAKSGDLLIAISTSGNSPNVIRAIDAAHEIGCKIIAFTGGSGGKMKMSDKVDANLNVDLGKNSCRIQETHIFIVHMIVDIMERFFLKKA